MSGGMKVYHWLNLILNPIILGSFLLAAISETNSEAIIGFSMGVGIAWSIISGIINEKLRKWVLGSLKAFISVTLVVAIFGLIVAAIIFAVVAAVYMIFGYIVLLIFLFFDSLIAVRNAQKGLI